MRGRSQGCRRGVLVGPGDVRPTTSEATICRKRAGTFRRGAGRYGSSGGAERSGVVPGRRPLEGAQEVAVESGHLRGAAAAAGTEGLEAAQLPGVSGDHRQAPGSGAVPPPCREPAVHTCCIQ